MLERIPAPLGPGHSERGYPSQTEASPRKKPRIIAFVNQKGGTGKTTLTQNLAACLALEHRQHVLCVDLDPQGNLGHSLITDAVTTTKTADRLLLVPSANVWEYILSVRPTVDLIPNRFQRDLRENVERLPLNENLLRGHLNRVQMNYDWILIDTPAGLNRSTQAGIDVADQVVIVMSSSSYAIKGTPALMAWIDEISNMPGKGRPLIRCVLNHFNERQRFDREIADHLDELFRDNIYQTRIRPSIRIVEAAAQAQSVIEYAPVSGAATDFRRLGRELLGLPVSVGALAGTRAGENLPIQNGTVLHTGSRLKLVS